MRKNHVAFAAAALVLAACFLVTAGCTSIPGPEARFTPIPTTTPVPVTPQVKVTTVKVTPVTVSVTPAVPIAAVTTAPEQGMYETRTCAGLGGFAVGPGQECPGTWISAGDTFNCCSTGPVRAVTQNVTVNISPLDLLIVMDDDPGSILP